MSTTKGIDFETLSLRDALDLAILVEEEAEERYKDFADQMDVHHTPEAAAFFRFMADNEAKHGKALSAQREQKFKGQPSAVHRGMLFDIEAPDFDEARAFMSPREAMTSALRAEIKAHAFFEKALPRVRDADVKALFAELRDEEVVHKDLVQKQLDKLPAESKLRTEDFADDPVSQ